MAEGDSERPAPRVHQRLRSRPSSVRALVTVALSSAFLLLLVVYNWRNRLSSGRFIVKPLEPGNTAGAQLDFFNGKARKLRSGPAVLMVTAAPSHCMTSALGASTLAKVLKNHADYARKHQYDIWFTFDELDQDLPPEWNKIVLLRKLMNMYRFQYDWFWWLDHETIITDLDLVLPFDTYLGQASLILGPSEDWFVYHEPSHSNINLGTFLLKNNFWSKKMLDTMQATRSEAVREDTEIYSSIRETVRGMPSVTDRAVLLYMLYNSRAHESEKRKVVFETIGFGGLDGSWKEACMKLESVQRQPHSAADGHDVPSVVHFGGCQFCSKDGEPMHESCQRHFTHAFNYADNQVLEGLGLKHMESTSTSSLQDLPQRGG